MAGGTYPSGKQGLKLEMVGHVPSERKRRKSGPYISFRLKHCLFHSQQLMKHQRIQVKSKKTSIHVILPQPKSAIHQPQKKLTCFSFHQLITIYFSKKNKPQRKSSEKNTSISHPPTIDFLVGSLQIHLQIGESNHKLPAMYRCHWYHS